MRHSFIFICLIGLLFLGCRPLVEQVLEPPASVTIQPEPLVNVSEPTPITATEIPNTAATELPPPLIITTTPTTAADITPIDTPLPSNQDTPEAILYKVVNVASDDVLNVRGGPGVDNPITGALAPDATGIQISGTGQLVGNSRWVPIVTPNTAGWVNSSFLAEMSTGEMFCTNPEVAAAVAAVRTAVAEQNGSQLAALVHPEGLSIGLSWWNPQINIPHNDVSNLFTSDEVVVWGTQDGSGNEIKGTFAEQILPVLQEDLLGATETGCNMLLAGRTAGIIRLPEVYTNTNFYALQRPAPADGIEFDWGTWVVGFTKANGRYYVRYLLHMAYEI